MNQKTKNIIKWVAIAVFVPTVVTVAYYGGKKVIQFVNKKKAEKSEVKETPIEIKEEDVDR